MAGIRGKNTKPELQLRRGLHARGFRFRLHPTDLPGKPDVVFPKHKAVLFAQGCFWHGHNCRLFKWPQSRPEFWKTKIDRNVERDGEVQILLTSRGWRVGRVWECALKGPGRLPADRLLDECVKWLLSNNPNLELAGNEARLSV